MSNTYNTSPPFVKRMVDELISVEGGYVNDPNDRGGATKYGITEKVAREHGYTGRMKNLPLSLAQDVYVQTYYYEPKLDVIEPYSDLITLEVFDTGVNCGTNTAVKLLQDSLNLLNRNQTDYKDISVDGLIGNQTTTALKSYLYKRDNEGEAVLYNLLNSQQTHYYAEICRNDPKQEHNFYGWVARRTAFFEVN